MNDEEMKALIDHARTVSGILEGYAFEDNASDAAALLNDLADALSALSSHPDEETEWGFGTDTLEPHPLDVGRREWVEAAIGKNPLRVMWSRTAGRAPGPWSPVPSAEVE